MTALAVVMIFVVGIPYLISCGLHPYKRCPECASTPGRNYGSVFRNNWRLCTRCGGRGRIRRTGSWLMNSGQKDLERPRIQGPGD